jgi:HAD superfamily hydrolase (TIGR01484 family)
MKYKALFLDLDGTTVGYASVTPTKRVIQAVRQAQQHLTVSIATGRILNHSQSIIDILGIRGYCILDQGTQVYDPVGQTMVSELVLERSVAQKAIDIFVSNSLSPYVFDGQENIPYKKGNTYSKVISVYAEDFPREKEEALRKDLHVLTEVSVHRMVAKKDSLASIEVTHALGTKQYGIEKIAQLMGIDTHEIIGVGDGYNDFPLLMACGLKVAMGNAVPELKAIADFIAPTVDEDGVATVIEKFILT